MLVLENNNIRFIFSHCQQCGFCENVCPTRAILMHQRNDGLSDIIIEQISALGVKNVLRFARLLIANCRKNIYLLSLIRNII